MTALFIDATSIAVSRQREQGMRIIGMHAPTDVAESVLGQGDPWFGREVFGEVSYLAGYAPMVDGEGKRIGMISAGFPDAPYRRAAWIVLGMIAALLALTMLAISTLFLRAGRELTSRLATISRTMETVRLGDRGARVAEPSREDELGLLTRDFNGLLDTIAAQDEMRRRDETKLEEYRRGLEVLVEHRTRELNERSEQLNAIFTLSPDGLVSFDGNRRIMFANQAFLAMTGMEADAVIGLDETVFSERLAGRCLPGARFEGVAALRADRAARDDGEACGETAERRHVFELAGPGGRVIDVGIRLSATGNVSQILYFSDVTHETEVDRMKSEFLSAAAHELRTPMASIYGFAELLLAQDFDEEMRREVVTTIFKQSELMASIINELLDLARIESRRGKDFVLEPVVLQEVVAEAVSGYKPPNGRPAPAVPDAEAPLHIRVDRKKIQQALLNVLSNAYKYSPQGGEVGIAYRHEDGRYGIEVRDRGIGMTPEQCSRVFERFYRADDSGTILGTGLGMSIVKEIVELHGGRVDVRSSPGEGSVVTLWIPVRD
jgi:signal transduction histidine kinase/HAMP domain-containing protein